VSLSVKVNDCEVSLSSYEYKLLEYLMMHLGEVKSKSVLTEHIYDQDFDLDSNVIEVFIRRLRKKLDPQSEYGFIETHRGQGYKLRRLDQ
jgi:two-component system response regulator PhoP